MLRGHLKKTRRVCSSFSFFFLHSNFTASSRKPTMKSKLGNHVIAGEGRPYVLIVGHCPCESEPFLFSLTCLLLCLVLVYVFLLKFFFLLFSRTLHIKVVVPLRKCKTRLTFSILFVIFSHIVHGTGAMVKTATATLSGLLVRGIDMTLWFILLCSWQYMRRRRTFN